MSVWHPRKHSLSTERGVHRGSARQLCSSFPVWVSCYSSFHMCSEGILCFLRMFFSFEEPALFSHPFHSLWVNMKTFALPCVWLLLSWTKRPFSPCLPYPTLDSVAMETHSLAGKGFCIPVGDCYKCAVSPLCVCVCFGETVPPPLSLWGCMHICVCV